MANITALGIRGWALALLMLLMVAGCATKPAPEYEGRWKAVNRYPATPQEIPLHRDYTFYPSPMDGTLKAMLERWARDSKMTLSYLHSSDFTLHSVVAQIRTNDLEEAVSELSLAYAAQGVTVSIAGNQLVVRDSSAATATPPSRDATAARP